jgi:uncharacterized protein with GYD domain
MREREGGSNGEVSGSGVVYGGRIEGVAAGRGQQAPGVDREAGRHVGGKLESVYYAFGKHDVIAIVDLPDNVSAAAVSMAIGASGAVTNTMTVLVTPEEIDAAVKKSPAYTPPGR